MSDLGNALVETVEEFLNDRKGFHVNDLDEDIQFEFKKDLLRDIRKTLKEYGV